MTVIPAKVIVRPGPDGLEAVQVVVRGTILKHDEVDVEFHEDGTATVKLPAAVKTEGQP